MGATFRFLSGVEEVSLVLDWFRNRPERPIEQRYDHSSIFHFREFGPLQSDAQSSPVVNVFRPIRKKGILTTVGEVHFLAKPITSIPGLHRVSRQFAKWLREYPCIFSRRSANTKEWDYYLEGSIRNYDADIYALPSGMIALQQGCYFVAECDGEHMLSKLIRTLELRGVEGIERE